MKPQQSAYPAEPNRPQVRARLRRLAWLLDSSIPVPGTNFRFGLDPVLGLFPVLGDALGALISSYIVIHAARLGAPKLVLLRMALNIGIETVIGAIPLAGTLFDAAWKANQRNVRLLDAWLERPRRIEHATRWFVALLVLALAALIALFAAATFLLVRALLALM